MTSTGIQGPSVGQVPGAGTKVTVAGTHSISSGTGAGTGLHSTGARPSSGSSSVRGTGHTDEQHEEVVVPQEATLGRRRPKWL